jgi:hypothetical protein
MDNCVCCGLERRQIGSPLVGYYRNNGGHSLLGSFLCHTHSYDASTNNLQRSKQSHSAR